ncbi:hypothetical protein [Pantoea sp. 1.19]|uniref:hypothetical protein n=1 Tax=Pantoea sp. 1.19 TaxID=1925589 RepID=UPI0011151BCF|nr:hypothetical protein [Pantoea sp. 1.19]
MHPFIPENGKDKGRKRQYHNQLAPQRLATGDQYLTTAEQLDRMNKARALIANQQADCRQHPVNALYRILVQGRLTRAGGRGRIACSGNQIERSDGRKVNVALVGEGGVYPDGRTAKILTDADKLVR